MFAMCIIRNCLQFTGTPFTYESGDAASADGGLEVTLQLLLDGTRGVKALSQKDDGVHKEEGGDAVDDVLKDLDPGHRETNQVELSFQPRRSDSLPWTYTRARVA